MRELRVVAGICLSSDAAPWLIASLPGPGTLRPMSFLHLVKYGTLTFFAAAMLACGSHRNAAESDAAIRLQEANQGFSTGRVTTEFIGDGCPLLIRVDHAKNLYLYPIGLEEKFRKHGLHLTFKYRPVKASTGDCRKGSAAEVDEVSLTPTMPKDQ